MDEEKIKKALEGVAVLRSEIQSRSAVVTAMYGKQGGAFYRFCVEAMRSRTTQHMLVSKLVGPVIQPLILGELEGALGAMFNHCADSSGISEEVQSRIRSMADTDYTALHERTKKLVQMLMGED